ncbi:MAG: class I SAM-dependent methyltransferase, partial [Symploca sp. SIO2D2]|nr:class I SAM-dependent methyltransferase [Symploca sp. SIO2D2]
MASEFEKRCECARCRSCGKQGLVPVIDLGSMPPSDRLLTRENLTEDEAAFPLELAFCEQCALVQILETVPADFLFSNQYLYFSSFSESLLKHSRDNALELIESQSLDSSSLVMELASNDGYLLKNFVQAGIPVQGIDPAPKQASNANSIGVPTINDFFSSELASKLKKEGKQADVIIANNVVAHVSDPHDFIEGISILLKPSGIASVEFPSVRELVDHLEFDTIYHEHLCYFSLISADWLFRRHGLYINDVREYPIHGGSFRLYIGKTENPTKELIEYRERERKLGLDRADYYKAFAERVLKNRILLRRLLKDL